MSKRLSISDQPQGTQIQDETIQKRYRGILKQSSSQNMDLTGSFHVTEINNDSNEAFTQPINRSDSLPIDRENNTTSKISMISSLNRPDRRVSFAPDVTLHSFNLVTAKRTPKDEKSTSNLVKVEKNSTASLDDSIERKDYDGEEMSMDLTQPTENIVKAKLGSETAQEFQNSHTSQLENRMELTEVFRADELSQPVGESMDFTERQEKLSPIILPFVDRKEYDTFNEQDATMDLTDMHLPQTAQSTQHSDTKLENREFTEVQINRNGEIQQQEESNNNGQKVLDTDDQIELAAMELTQIRKDGSFSQKSSFEESQGEEMDLTENIQKPYQYSLDNEQTKKQSANNMGPPLEPEENMTMELTSVQRDHTPPGKRRKLTKDANSSEAISNAEKMSPIRSLEIQQKSLSPSYSLREFIEGIGDGFLPKISLLQKNPKKITFSYTKPLKGPEPAVEKVYATLQYELPVLQLKNFIALELLRRNNQSNLDFMNLQEQIKSSSSPPLLLKEYYESSTDIQEAMNQQLQILKGYSTLVAKKNWCKWQISQLERIKEVLKENVAALDQKVQTISSKLSTCRDIAQKTERIKDWIKQDILLLKDPPEIHASNTDSLKRKVKLESMKRYLAVQKLTVEKLPVLIKENEELKTRLKESKEKLVELEKITREQSVDKGEEKIKQLQNKLDFVKMVTGIHLIGVDQTTLIARFDTIPGIEFTFNTNVKCDRLMDLNQDSLVLGSFSRFLMEHLVFSRFSSDVKVGDVLSDILLRIRKTGYILRQYRMLSLLFITHCNVSEENNPDTETTIELKDFDLEANSKIVYILSFSQFLRMIRHGCDDKLGISISAKSNNNNLTAQGAAGRICERTANIWPWLMEKNITVQIR
ncbi:kinetochore-microtubule binding complex subunit SPC105 KNAG_0F02180 [Huiozyma naganishii CBS 8797]|uniref:Spc7 kinetochore protein domain-containing protein n=1 Tax=Huiozyma naganishii (strain ATCC MYA-139 / BCRC 22969 / CBS 8797 / KCTC 17520 / NBRC 10181 / NCYC 3082 / Yp74L-3) TaxID=1071383 RepID=J7R7N6_HUIN7|nr:hypothetical protein KNAG_0F02180 [Kazachstania naganishii CBS 8797]CCK70885.1 hypothetical protein KNAG_0F02180 [Kazachstania naganishii CBS 8797]